MPRHAPGEVVDEGDAPAPEARTPPPATITGRSALASASAMRRAVAASTAGFASAPGAWANAPAGSSAEKKSIGTSTSTTPLRPDCAS